jgi:pSer/pThr/pTyr-binding forkhead associated (FHA) protein
VYHRFKPAKLRAKRLLEPPAYKLVISDDEGHTTVVPLLRDEVTIGREQGNTIRLTERNVSRNHARLLRRNGSYLVEDLGSYNGVSVNGRLIDSRTKLSAGDRLAIGDYGLAFQRETAAVITKVPSIRPRSQPPPRLVVIGEPAAGAEFSLNKPTLRIGRDENLDIWINHKSISHEHAEFRIADGKVSVFDLESANGMRVNGIQASRAVLETGDILQLGQVRFRFLPAEGAHSLIPAPEEAIDKKRPSSAPKKPLFVLGVVALLVAVGAGAVFGTLRSDSDLGKRLFSGSEGEKPTTVTSSQPVLAPDVSAPKPASAAVEEGAAADEPQEWERELVRARRALARGRFDRAYGIANDLPEDSVLRDTPEFGEIRYRYVQSHIQDGEAAFADADFARAIAEAELALGVSGITPKQRQEARRLLRRAVSRQGLRIVD